MFYNLISQVLYWVDTINNTQFFYIIIKVNCIKARVIVKTCNYVFKIRFFIFAIRYFSKQNFLVIL